MQTNECRQCGEKWWDTYVGLKKILSNGSTLEYWFKSMQDEKSSERQRFEKLVVPNLSSITP